MIRATVTITEEHLPSFVVADEKGGEVTELNRIVAKIADVIQKRSQEHGLRYMALGVWQVYPGLFMKRRRDDSVEIFVPLIDFLNKIRRDDSLVLTYFVLISQNSNQTTFL
jgi:hypothetical protein